MSSSQCKIERKSLYWTINNLDNHPGGVINSIIFPAGNPRHSLCYIKIFIDLSKKEGKQALSHQLVFLCGSYQRGYTYKVCVVNKDGKTKPLPRYNSIIKNCNFLEKEFFTGGGSVTLRCHLTFQKETFEHATYVKDVSTRIGSLRKMSEFSDLILVVDDEEIHVHRFLLQQRCSNFLKYLGVNGESRVKVDISRPVLKAILLYIYRGKLSRNLPVENLSEFYKIAEVCEFEELTKEIFDVTEKTSICTDIRVSRQKIFWDINVKDLFRGKVPLFKPVKLDCALFLLKASLKRFSRRLSVQIDIHCSSALGERMLLNCIATIAMEENVCNPHYEVTHPGVRLQFSLQDEIQHLNYVVNQTWPKDSNLQITLSIALSKGENTCSFEDMDLAFPSRLCPVSQSVFGMSLLSFDLAVLYHETTQRDFKIFFNNSSFLNMHRAILAASSPVFYRMLCSSVAQRSDSVYLDIKYWCGVRLVQYLYTGEVLNCGHVEDLAFLEAVNRYQVPDSANKLTKLLASHLSM